MKVLGIEPRASLCMLSTLPLSSTPRLSLLIWELGSFIYLKSQESTRQGEAGLTTPSALEPTMRRSRRKLGGVLRAWSLEPVGLVFLPSSTTHLLVVLEKLFYPFSCLSFILCKMITIPSWLGWYEDEKERLKENTHSISTIKMMLKFKSIFSVCRTLTTYKYRYYQLLYLFLDSWILIWTKELFLFPSPLKIMGVSSLLYWFTVF